MAATRNRMAVAEKEFPERLPAQPAGSELGHHELLLRQRRAVHRRPGPEPFCALPVHTRGRPAQPRPGGEAAKSADYLSEELAARVAADAVRFTWHARTAEALQWDAPWGKTIPPRPTYGPMKEQSSGHSARDWATNGLVKRLF